MIHQRNTIQEENGNYVAVKFFWITITLLSTNTTIWFCTVHEMMTRLHESADLYSIHPNSVILISWNTTASIWIVQTSNLFHLCSAFLYLCIHYRSQAHCTVNLHMWNKLVTKCDKNCHIVIGVQTNVECYSAERTS